MNSGLKYTSCNAGRDEMYPDKIIEELKKKNPQLKIKEENGRRLTDEIETVINFDGNDDMADVFTYHRPIIRRLLRHKYVIPLTAIVRNGKLVGLEVLIPRNCICFTKDPRGQF